MKRIIEAEIETNAKKFKTAINRFFNKFPDLEYWKEEIEYMHENGIDFECDNVMANGEKNNDWGWVIHLDEEENYFYICVIERA